MSEFIGDWAEADPSVIDYAQEIVKKYHPLLIDAKIGFLFRKEATERAGRIVLGQASKVSPKMRPFMDYDFIIWIAKPEWDSAPENRRRAIIDHELCHCTIGANGWAIRPHDFEEFTEIVERHGFWTYDLMKVQEMARQEKLPGFAGEGKISAVEAKQLWAVKEQPGD